MLLSRRSVTEVGGHCTQAVAVGMRSVGTVFLSEHDGATFEPWNQHLGKLITTAADSPPVRMTHFDGGSVRAKGTIVWNFTCETRFFGDREVLRYA